MRLAAAGGRGGVAIGGLTGSLPGAVIGGVIGASLGVAGGILLGDFVGNLLFNENADAPAEGFDGDQDAAIQLAKDAKRQGGLSPDEAEALVEIGKEVGLPARGPESHPGRKFGSQPHIHVGPINHIPVITP